MSGPARRAVELFAGALERPPSERLAWLDARTRDDPELRREVKELLEAHELEDGILDRGDPPADTPETRRIGAYRVLRELGRGGMGVVYLAERADGQFRRRVAVKLLRGSPDADELHRRFRAERQILAALNHPNIAQLLDGGITDGRLPYLVMEYVEGLPITEYCDRRQLPVEARLNLFREVCAAVHHAHRNLVVHRDLKPSNILVTPEGQVKLLDFGIAKLLNPDLSALEMPVTRSDLRVLTPEYASPEQVRGESFSTASDVYSLGVVLYELLAGCHPHAERGEPPADVFRAVLDTQPTRPSHAVGRAPGSEGIAEARGTSNAARLQRVLRGDLDAIVLMALRSEPERRYGSADLLAADILRYLEGLPVMAHRGSRMYRAAKLLRRHRAGAVAASLVVLSISVGAGAALWQASVARQERDRAEAARIEAEEALERSEEVGAFLTGLFESLDPERTPGADAAARELLARGAARVEALAGQPLVQAGLMEVIGRVYTSVGQYDAAQAQLERALEIRRAGLGPSHPDVAGTLAHLADVFRRTGDFRRAEALAEEALEIRRTTLGEDDPSVAESLIQLSGLAVYRTDLEAAEQLGREALDLRLAALGPDHPEVARGLEHLAAVLRRRGRQAEAETHLLEALALRERIGEADQPPAAYLMLRLADLRSQEFGQLEDAEDLYRRAITLLERALGPEHPRVAWALGDLSGCVAQQGRLEESERLVRRASAILDAAYGPQSTHSVAMRGLLGRYLSEAGRHEEASTYVSEELEFAERFYGRAHTRYTGALGRMSEIRRRQGRLEEAEALAREAVRIRREEMGERSTPLLGLAIQQVARIRRDAGDFEQADALYHEALDMLLLHTAPEHHDVRRVYGELADLYERWDRPAEAGSFRARALLR